MKVKDLIEKLNGLDQDHEVYATPANFFENDGKEDYMTDSDINFKIVTVLDAQTAVGNFVEVVIDLRESATESFSSFRQRTQ